MAEAAKLPPVPLSRIWALQKHDWPLILAGAIGALGGGTIQPIFSLLYAGIITTSVPPHTHSF